jgi:hypothetical protein
MKEQFRFNGQILVKVRKYSMQNFIESFFFAGLDFLYMDRSYAERERERDREVERM